LSRRSLLHGVWVTANEPHLLAVKHHRSLLLPVNRPLQRFHICMIRIISASCLSLNTETMTTYFLWREILQEFKRKLCLTLCFSVTCPPHFLPQGMVITFNLKSCGRSVPAVRVSGSHPNGSYKQHGAVGT
jgi:hypothetical protein